MSIWSPLPSRPRAGATVGEWTAYCDRLRPLAEREQAGAGAELAEAEWRVYRMILAERGDPLARVRDGGTP